MRTIVASTALLGALVSPAYAQSSPRVEFFGGAEELHFTYRFENDSSFDTAFLVPHFFEQKYEKTGPVAGARVGYMAWSRRMETAVFAGLEKRAFGSDFDTFFQPDGDVAVSGTAGGVDLASIGLAQEIGLVARASWHAAALLRYRRDRADFHPADRVVTHTQPPSETRTFITDRERTVSQTFEVGLAAARYWRAADSPWRAEIGGTFTPALRARLLVQLPDKYPGRDIVFTAAGWSAGARASVARALKGWEAGAWLAMEKAGSYREAARFDRRVLTAGASLAFGSRH